MEEFGIRGLRPLNQQDGVRKGGNLFQYADTLRRRNMSKNLIHYHQVEARVVREGKFLDIPHNEVRNRLGFFEEVLLGKFLSDGRALF